MSILILYLLNHSAVTEEQFNLLEVMPAAVCTLLSRCCTLQVCSVLHQQYAEFGGGVVQAFAGMLGPGAAEADQSLARRRTLLRLLAQLLLAGVSDEWAALVQVSRTCS